MINYRGIAKLFVYLLSYALFILMIYVSSQVMWGTNTQGGSCNPYVWGNYGIIGTLSFDTYFQWIWVKEPCRFTEEFYFCIYFVAIPLYLLFKYLCKKNWHKPTSLQINTIEFVVGWCIYLCFLLIEANHQGVDITLNVVYNAFIGTFLLLYPMLCLIFLISLSRKIRKQ